MKIKELREKSEGELQKLLEGKREAVRKLRFDIASRQVKNHREGRNTKKDIARILTILKKR